MATQHLEQVRTVKLYTSLDMMVFSRFSGVFKIDPLGFA